MSQVTWVLESDVFPTSHKPLRAALKSAGLSVLDWRDEWWAGDTYPKLDTVPAVFHGSLGNAATIAERLPWKPGAFCKASAFHCSAWYEAARRWLLHRDWRVLPANDFVTRAPKVCSELGCTDRVFVRPDSPLKPFSGRVLAVDAITLEALDHGFYYDEETLPIVVAPVRAVASEWRFVVVRSRVVAGSAYDPATRSALSDTPASSAWHFADLIASELPPPQEVYVLDVCEADGELRLLELNPFSGADLYACSSPHIVAAVSEVADDVWHARAK
jgi:hypothetical protein